MHAFGLRGKASRWAAGLVATPALALGGAVLAMSAAAGPASAAFPGQNGKILFTRQVGDSGREQAIWVMNPDGTNPTQLTSGTGSDDQEPRWSADGTRIVFTREGPSIGNTTIWVMNADGSGQTQLTTTNGDENPAWSPDGTKIVFARGPSEGENLWIMNADGTNPTQFTSTTGDSEPAWSPDGTRIVFVTGGADGGERLSVINADGTGREQVTAGANREEENPVWSPDGSRIAFTQTYNESDHQDVFTMNPDGSGQTNVTNNVAGTSSGRPAWSPDGTKIAFAQGAGADSPDTDHIFVRNAVDGSDPTQLTGSGTNFNGQPDWQPIRVPSPPSAPAAVVVTPTFTG
jgi:Tol biopolymer transport system component